MTEYAGDSAASGPVGPAETGGAPVAAGPHVPRPGIARAETDPGAAAPEISVVVPTYGRPGSLADCLRALAGQTLARARFEVVVCDDGSPEPVATVHARLLAELADDLAVRVVRQPNAGPAAARNHGAEAARGRYLAFTDDDCVPAEDWLERLLERFAAAPDALVGGGLRNGYPADACAAATQAIMDFVYVERERVGGVRLFSTSNLALPAAGFRAIGGFSREFPDAAGEDYDLCWRWHEAGRPAVYAPEAWIEHRHALTLRSFARQHFNYGRGLLRVRRRRDARTGSGVGTSRGFFPRLVLHPLRQGWRLAAWRTTALIALSQAATATGALVERVRPSRPRPGGLEPVPGKG